MHDRFSLLVPVLIFIYIVAVFLYLQYRRDKTLKQFEEFSPLFMPNSDGTPMQLSFTPPPNADALAMAHDNETHAKYGPVLMQLDGRPFYKIWLMRIVGTFVVVFILSMVFFLPHWDSVLASSIGFGIFAAIGVCVVFDFHLGKKSDYIRFYKTHMVMCRNKMLFEYAYDDIRNFAIYIKSNNGLSKVQLPVWVCRIETPGPVILIESNAIYAAEKKTLFWLKHLKRANC